MSTIEQTPAGIIDGAAVNASRHSVFPVIDPSTEEVLAEVPVCDGATVETAVTAAARAFGGWADTSLGARDNLLNALADTLLTHKQELADIEARNTGKPRSAALSEVAGAAARLRYAGAAARTVDRKASVADTGNRMSFLHRDPIGVIGQVTPWNYPLMAAAWIVGPALAAGNTVVLKPSELTPLTTLRMAELAAGILPPGVLNVIAGNGETTGTVLARHPSVRMVSLTSGMAIGHEAPADTAPSAKRRVDPDRNAPVIVLADADLNRVAERLRKAGFANSGQDLTAACRVLVAESRYDDLLAALVPAVRLLRVAGPFDGETDVGPVISEWHQRRVMGYIERAVAAGAEIAVGGHTPADTGYFVEPTVIGSVPQHLEIARTGVFGPVITVQRFTDEAEALDIANGMNHGLTASVWSENVGRCVRMAHKLRFGTVWVNEHVTLVDEARGDSAVSGYGGHLSPYAVEDFTVAKNVIACID